MNEKKEVQFLKSYMLSAHQIIPEYDRLLDYAQTISQKVVVLENKLSELTEKDKE